jgi:hypothetical protein
MTEDKRSKPPEGTKGDLAQVLAKAGISLIPVVGGPAAELFGYIVKPPLEKRRDEWLKTIGERVKKLEETGGFKMESLADNPLFITVVTQATTIALRNHQQEKLEALQNAVVNTASGISIDENLQLLFLSLVDYLTPLHLKVLVYFNDPAGWFRAQARTAPQLTGGSPVHGIEEAFNGLRGRREIYDPIVEELYNRGLLNTDKTGMHVMMTSILDPRTTPLGKQFIKYVSIGNRS